MKTLRLLSIAFLALLLLGHSPRLVSAAPQNLIFLGGDDIALSLNGDGHASFTLKIAYVGDDEEGTEIIALELVSFKLVVGETQTPLPFAQAGFQPAEWTPQRIARGATLDADVSFNVEDADFLAHTYVAQISALAADGSLATQKITLNRSSTLAASILKMGEAALEYGPPVPARIEIPVEASGNLQEELRLSARIVAVQNSEGESVDLASHSGECVSNAVIGPGESGKQIVSPPICFTEALTPENTGLDRGSYDALIAVFWEGVILDSEWIKLTLGTPPRIVSSEIVVRALGCPNFINRPSLRGFSGLLCPHNLWSANLERFNPFIINRTNIVYLSGPIDSDFLVPEPCESCQLPIAMGSAVNTDGEGSVSLFLDELLGRNEYRIAVFGSSNSGRYEGQFSLDPREGEGESVDVTVLVSDDGRLPFIVILLGLVLSTYVTWFFGPRKKAVDTKQKAAGALKSINRLYASTQDFLTVLENDKERRRFYAEDPDVIFEIEQLHSTKGKIKLDSANTYGKLGELDLLFPRFRSFFEAHFQAHQTLDALEKESPKACKPKVANLRAEFLRAKEKLWSADTEKRMEFAQDLLIRALVHLNELVQYDKDCQIDEANLGDLDRIRNVNDLLETLDESSEPDSAQDESLAIRLPFMEWLLSRKTFNLANIIRLAVICLSGYYVVYLSNPVFGSVRDYAFAFLWGTATESALASVNAIVGSSTSFMTVVKGVVRK